MGVAQIFNLMLIGALSAAVIFVIMLYQKLKFSKEMINKNGSLWVIFSNGVCQDLSPDFNNNFQLKKGDRKEKLFANLLPVSAEKLSLAYDEMDKNYFAFECQTKNNEFYHVEGKNIKEKQAIFLSKISSKEPQILSKQKAAFTHILKAIPGVIWQQDKKENITLLTDLNQDVSFKSDQADLMLKTLHEPRFNKLAKRALRLGTMQQEDFVVSTLGSKKYFRVYQQPMEDSKSTIGFAYDITSFKEKERKWQKSTQVYGKALNHLSMAVALFSSEGFLCYFNKAYVNLYNFDATWLKSKPHVNEILEELRRCRQLPEYVDFNEYKREQLKSLSSYVEGFQEELFHLPDERTLRLISTSYPLGGTLFLIEDITQQLVLERSNKSLLASHHTSLTHLFEGILMISSDYRIKLVNPSFTKLWQLGERINFKEMHVHEVFEMMKGLFISDLHWSQHRQALSANISERRSAKGSMTHREGFDIQFTYTPLPNGDHLVTYLADGQQDVMPIEDTKSLAGMLG